VFPIIRIDEASVRLDNTIYPPTIVLSFSSMNYPRTTTTISDDVAFILIRVLNDEHTLMKHRILCQSYLHCLCGLKYNILPYNDIVVVNERHTIIQSKTIRYNPMCLTQVSTIWHLRRMFRKRSLQQNLISVT
jgi:hypothetical protein